MSNDFTKNVTVIIYLFQFYTNYYGLDIRLPFSYPYLTCQDQFPSKKKRVKINSSVSITCLRRRYEIIQSTSFVIVTL